MDPVPLFSVALAAAALAALLAAVLLFRGQLAEARRRVAAAEQARDALQTKLDDVGKRLAEEAALGAERARSAAETIRLLREDRETMVQRFRLLADEAMARHGESVTKQNKEQIDATLTPLRAKLVEFQDGLQKAHAESDKERVRLAEQIRSLTEASAKMTSETQNLAEALRGKAQMRGAWGEMILSSILEKSGLVEGEQYRVQQSHVTEEGRRLQSDVIVQLPNEQSLVIDSKVSLVAFESYVNAEEEQERAQALERHVAAVEAQIRSLARKEYHVAAAGSPDFVVMFIPIEGALALALQVRPNLATLAIESNVGIATPTTLMIALRTAANVWSVEKRNRNAEQIAERAGRLHDKLVAFVEDMTALGNRLAQARGAYDDAMKKLSTGNGNALRQVQQLKVMGAKTSKSLLAALVEDDRAEGTLTPAEP